MFAGEEAAGMIKNRLLSKCFPFSSTALLHGVAGEGRKEFKAECGKINFKTGVEGKGGWEEGRQLGEPVGAALDP